MEPFTIHLHKPEAAYLLSRYRHKISRGNSGDTSNDKEKGTIKNTDTTRKGAAEATTESSTNPQRFIEPFVEQLPEKERTALLEVWDQFSLAYRIYDDLIDDDTGSGTDHEKAEIENPAKHGAGREGRIPASTLLEAKDTPTGIPKFLTNPLFPLFLHTSGKAMESLGALSLAPRIEADFIAALNTMHHAIATSGTAAERLENHLFPDIRPHLYLKSCGIIAMTTLASTYCAAHKKVAKSIHRATLRRIRCLAKHFILARQLSDDAADWHDDIARAPRSKVGTKKDAPDHKDLKNLMNHFDRTLAPRYAEAILWHSMRAREIAHGLMREKVFTAAGFELIESILSRIFSGAKKVFENTKENQALRAAARNKN